MLIGTLPRSNRKRSVPRRSGASSVLDPVLAEAMRCIEPGGMRIGHRIIQAEDEYALLPDELVPLEASVAKVRRQSGSVRIVARQLAAELGYRGITVPTRARGAPAWPAGIVGSLAHDACIAVAAVALSRDFASVGIDVEPSEPLPARLAEVVSTAAERRRDSWSPLEARVLFSVKEAVFKAVHPLDGIFLGFKDIEVDLAAGTARVRYGREVKISVAVSSRIVALACLENVRAICDAIPRG